MSRRLGALQISIIIIKAIDVKLNTAVMLLATNNFYNNNNNKTTTTITTTLATAIYSTTSRTAAAGTTSTAAAVSATAFCADMVSLHNAGWRPGSEDHWTDSGLGLSGDGCKPHVGGNTPARTFHGKNSLPWDEVRKTRPSL